MTKLRAPGRRTIRGFFLIDDPALVSTRTAEQICAELRKLYRDKPWRPHSRRPRKTKYDHVMLARRSRGTKR